MKKPTVFLISGYARAGKDTLADGIASGLEACTTLHFATPLKAAVNRYFTALGIESVDVNRTEDKVRFRDLLVAAGKAARSVNREVFADNVALSAKLEVLRGRSVVIADWRYANEYHAVRRALPPGTELIPIYLSREGLQPANAEERETIEGILEQGLARFSYSFPENAASEVRDLGLTLAQGIPCVPAA